MYFLTLIEELMLNLDFAATFSIAEFICFTVVGSEILASHIDV